MFLRRKAQDYKKPASQTHLCYTFYTYFVKPILGQDIMGNNEIHNRRASQIWRAGGMFWMVSITFFFAAYDLYFAELAAWLTVIIGMAVLVISLALFMRCLKTLRLAKQMPGGKSTGDEKGGSMRKWFIIIIVLEIAGFNIAPFVLLQYDHIEYIVPVEILIASLHFIPLGWVFKMPVYYVLGISMSLITILTICFIPATAKVGHLMEIEAAPSLSFIVINWIIISYVLNDAMKYVRKIY